MLSIEIAIAAYFINAVVVVIDKYLLAGRVKDPDSYAFYVAVLSAFVVVLIPFGVHGMPLGNLAVGIGSGVAFFIGLLFLYRALRYVDVTEVSPAVGALTALATFLFGLIFLPATLTLFQVAALTLLICGSLLLSYFHLTSRIVVYLMGGGAAFGLSYVWLKLFFDSTDFVNGLFWTRLGLVLAALLMLLIPSRRRAIGAAPVRSGAASSVFFVFNKVLATIGAVMIYYAIKIGNVVFINAIQGIEYVFVFIFGFFLAYLIPRLSERHARKLTPRRAVAIIAVVLGLVLLFV